MYLDHTSTYSLLFLAARQLYGSSEHHQHVRETACSHIQSNPGEYEVFFEGADHLQEYVEAMREVNTWGDELTMKACADAFGYDHVCCEIRGRRLIFLR